MLLLLYLTKIGRAFNCFFVRDVYGLFCYLLFWTFCAALYFFPTLFYEGYTWTLH